MKTFGEFVEMYERKLGSRKNVDRKKPKEYTCDECGVKVKSKDDLRLSTSIPHKNICDDCYLRDAYYGLDPYKWDYTDWFGTPRD